ncbi:MAG: adenylate/guanylate cyclase domain-containing protein [Elusimicrobiota bacterium]
MSTTGPKRPHAKAAHAERPGSAAERVPRREPAGAGPRRIRRPPESILIIEDDPSMLSVVTRALDSPRRGILAAESADEALVFLDEQDFDLVITDVVMPGGMDGRGLFRWVREHRPNTDTILVSGFPSIEGVLEAFRHGAWDYLVKPLDLGGLESTVLRCIQRRRAEDDMADEVSVRTSLRKAYRELNAMDGMRDALRRYLAKEVADKVMFSPHAALKGERIIATMLFADIRGFTTFAESHPPEEAVAVLNSLFERFNAVVKRRLGVVNKYTGDGLMAIFGALQAVKDHAQRAALCALDMIDETAEWNERRRAEGRLPLDIGIGINTGEVVAGSIGTFERSEYTVVGSAVNLAERLEHHAAPGQILVGPGSVPALSRSFRLRFLGSDWFKGFSRPSRVYELSRL